MRAARSCFPPFRLPPSLPPSPACTGLQTPAAPPVPAVQEETPGRSDCSMTSNKGRDSARGEETRSHLDVHAAHPFVMQKNDCAT